MLPDRPAGLLPNKGKKCCKIFPLGWQKATNDDYDDITNTENLSLRKGMLNPGEMTQFLKNPGLNLYITTSTTTTPIKNGLRASE